jgi:hypothetical protein
MVERVSPTTSKEAANSEDNLIKSVGLELTALRLCGHSNREPDLVTKFNVSTDVRSYRKLVRISQTQKIGGLRT